MHHIAYTALLITCLFAGLDSDEPTRSTTQENCSCVQSARSEKGKWCAQTIQEHKIKKSEKTICDSNTNCDSSAQNNSYCGSTEKKKFLKKRVSTPKSSDLFSFLRLSFQQKTLRFIRENPKLLEYFPVGVGETIIKSLDPEVESEMPTFVEKLGEAYNDLLNYLPDFLITSNSDNGQEAKGAQVREDVHDATLSSALCAKGKLTPILFVPGLLGSALEERRSNATGLPTECKISSSSGEWNRSWVSVASFLGYRCWREVLKLSIRDSVDSFITENPSEDAKESIAEWSTKSISFAFRNLLSAIFDLFAPKTEETVDHVQSSNTCRHSLDAHVPKSTHNEFSRHLMRAKFPAGIEVRPVTDGIEATRCLDSSNNWTCQTTSYFKDLLTYMTKKIVAHHTTKSTDAGFTQAPDATSSCESTECPQYELRKNIEVISFDFRLGGYELYHSMESKCDAKVGEYGGFFEKLKRKIEDLYLINGKERVAVVTHSLGGPLTVAFLNTYVDEKWKNKHVKKLITVAAPFGGAIKAMQAALLGETESFLLPAWSTQSMLSSWPGIYMVFPNAPKTNDDNESIPAVVEVKEAFAANNRSSFLSSWVSGIGNFFSSPISNESSDQNETFKKYSAHDLPQVLREHPNVSNVYAAYLERLRPLFDAFRVPPRGVDIDCIYSTGIKTTKKLIYRTFDENDVFTPQVLTDEDGDGTVRTESLGLCRSWQTDANIDVNIVDDEYVDLFGKFQKNPVRKEKRSIRRTIKLDGVNHVDIISNTPEVWDFILQSVNAE